MVLQICCEILKSLTVSNRFRKSSQKPIADIQLRLLHSYYYFHYINSAGTAMVVKKCKELRIFSFHNKFTISQPARSVYRKRSYKVLLFYYIKNYIYLKTFATSSTVKHYVVRPRRGIVSSMCFSSSEIICGSSF